MYQELLEPRIQQHTSPYSFRNVEHIQDIIAAMKQAAEQVEQFALVTIAFYFAGRERGSLATDESVCSLLTQIRSLTRKTDIVLRHHHACYFLLLDANRQGGQIVQERLREALLWRVHNTEDDSGLRPWNMTIGYSAYPAPQATFQECLLAAHETQYSLYLSPQEFSPVRNETPEDDLPLLARRLGVPYLALLPHTFPARLKQLVTPQVARELQCYPLGCERNTLTVAMANPRDRQALNRLAELTGMRIFPVLAHPQALAQALQKL